MAKNPSFSDLRKIRQAVEKLSKSGGGDLTKLGLAARSKINRAISQTPAGRLARDLTKAARSVTGNSNQSGRTLSREAVRQMSKLPELGPLGGLIGDIEKYASGRGGGLNKFIRSIGPIGSLFQAVVGAIRGGSGVKESDLIAAAKLLTAAGYKVTDPISAGLAGMAAGMGSGSAGSTTASPPRSPASPQIPTPTRSPPGRSPNAPPGRYPPLPPGQLGQNQPGQTGESEPIFAPGSYQTNAPPLPGQESPFSHEILTPQSSNVFAFTYDPQTSTLYVTYKANRLHEGQVHNGAGRLGGQQQLRGWIGHTVAGKTNERGPMYAYYDVPARVFNRMRLAASKGKFVWDELRVRGTIHGHKYRYSLAQGSITLQNGISGVYIPRKSTKVGFTVRSVAVVGSGRRAYQSSTLPGQSGHGTSRR